MTEIGLMRLCSVPEALVKEIRAHAQGDFVRRVPACLKCIHPPDGGTETRYCEQATAMIERCLKFLEHKRLKDPRRTVEPPDEP